MLDMLWVLWEYVYLVPTRTTTIHESLVNRLTYGCKPVKRGARSVKNVAKVKKRYGTAFKTKQTILSAG